jgi:predicted MFS family arabinose efflux permease
VKGGAAHRLGVALLTTSAGALPVFLTSALILQIAADLRFEIEHLGNAVGVYFFAGVLTSALMGRASERLGAASALRVGAVLSAFCLLSIALARDFATLTASLFLGGVCNALCQPAANLYVTRAISPSRRGLALALKQSAIPAATLIGGVAVPLVALTVGWRWSFVICAAMAAATALAVPEIATAAMSDGEDGRDAAPRPAMLLLAATVGFGAAAAGCLASFAVAGAARIGIADAAAGWLVAFGSALAVATRIGAGYRADFRSGGHLELVGRMLLIGGVAAVALRSQSAAAFALAVPVVFAAGWGWPGLFNLAVISHNPATPAAATGFTQTGTYLGAAIGPMLFGLVAERLSWTAAWSMVPLFFALAVLSATAARRALASGGDGNDVN